MTHCGELLLTPSFQQCLLQAQQHSSSSSSSGHTRQVAGAAAPPRVRPSTAAGTAAGVATHTSVGPHAACPRVPYRRLYICSLPPITTLPGFTVHTASADQGEMVITDCLLQMHYLLLDPTRESMTYL